MSSVRTRLTASLAASAILLGSVAALGGSPAYAAPGDASASGVTARVTVNILGQPALGVNGLVGSVTAPPDAGDTIVNANIGVPGTAAVTAGVIQVDVASSSAASLSASEVTGATLSVPVVDALIGGPILGTGTSVIGAFANCDEVAVPTTSFGDTATLMVAGQPVTLDVNGEATINVLTILGANIGTVNIRTDVSNISTDTATATALIATVNLNVIGVASVNGEVRIAEASCERPLDLSPTATGMTPNEGPTTGGQTVTITGTNFVTGDTQVVVDGVVVPAGDVIVVSPTELTYTTPAHAVGTVDVYVITPVSSTTTLPYTYVEDGTITDAPAVSGIDPDSGPVAGGQVVTITGENFIAGDTEVVVDGVVVDPADVTVVSSTEVVYFSPTHIEGPVSVYVSTSNGDSDTLTYTYVDDDSGNGPVAGNIDPNQGPVEGGTTVTIEGSGFIPGETTVTIDGIVIPADEVTVGGDGVTLTFVTPPHAAGPVDVTVTVGSETTDPLTFTYIDSDTTDETTIETIDPEEGPTEGGNTITLTGTCFVDGETTVTIGGIVIPANMVAINDDGTEIQFVAPAHAAGEVEVTVDSPCGESNAVTYTYITNGGVDPIVPEPTTPVDGPTDPMFANCDEVFAAGLSDLTASDPGYGPHLDRDGDGVACESNKGPGNGNPGDRYRSPSNPDALPRTGSDSAPLVMGGVLTILVGGAMLATRRRMA